MLNDQRRAFVACRQETQTWALDNATPTGTQNDGGKSHDAIARQRRKEGARGQWVGVGARGRRNCRELGCAHTCPSSGNMSFCPGMGSGHDAKSFTITSTLARPTSKYTSPMILATTPPHAQDNTKSKVHSECAKREHEHALLDMCMGQAPQNKNCMHDVERKRQSRRRSVRYPVGRVECMVAD